jgi:ABC-type polysaccharide/polyol phosphate transport system ATPase subunit
MTAISFDNVSKRYRKGRMGYRTLREDIYGLSSRLIRPGKDVDKDFIWALKDVSFQVDKGETLGIIGPNGAGKTTALRLLAGITKPTDGSISVKGRMGVLIELHAGFHPELTGRDNVYLNGSILGMSRSEIDRKYDAIVEFSGLEDFISTPVKRYSSGMLVRLGFSVAIHVDPEVLLVDEVLAVGDYAFQTKCYNRIDRLRESGIATIFVSHNMDRIRQYCDRVLLLEHGSIVRQGPADEVCEHYVRSAQQRITSAGSGQAVDTSSLPRLYGPVLLDSERVKNVCFELVDEKGEQTHRIRTGDNAAFRFSFEAPAEINDMEIAVSFYSQDGWYMTGVNTRADEVMLPAVQGHISGAIRIEKFALYPGEYIAAFAISDRAEFLYRDPRLLFAVEYEKPYWGLFQLDHGWELNVE